MNGHGAIVREEGTCTNGEVVYFCGSLQQIGKCTDGSKRKLVGVIGYGGDGRETSANSPLPGLEISLAQFKALGVPANRIVMVGHAALSVRWRVLWRHV